MTQTKCACCGSTPETRLAEHPEKRQDIWACPACDADICCNCEQGGQECLNCPEPDEEDDHD